MQINWIGKSSGAQINFEVQGTDSSIKVFTTRPDTLFGATFLVLAPEHPLVGKIASPDQKAKVEGYVRTTQTKSDIERQEEKKAKTGIFTGAYAINPASNQPIPIWIADYVLMGYGTGAIMAVPGHDQRDFEFAKKFELPVKFVVEPTFGEAQGDDTHKKAVFVILRNPQTNQVVVLDWGPREARHGGKMLIGGGVENDESYQATAEREIVEETGYKNFKFVHEAEFAGHGYFYSNTKNKNMHVSGKGLLFDLVDEQKSKTNLDHGEKNKFKVTWEPIDKVADMLDDGVHEAFYRYLALGEVYTGEGLMANSGDFSGTMSEQMREQIVADLSAKAKGEEQTNYKMRDWLISRQRYWGAPIPIIHCPNDGIVPVPEADLPVKLPEIKSYEPSGDGRSPLARVPQFVNVKCPTCGGPAERETDTMDGFACSSWYFLRFADPHNDKEPFSQKLADKWLPVDDYIGGAEHAVMHLLYARFWTKVMYDEGLIKFEEPFTTLRNHGMILAPDGQKMSKSKGNTIEPDNLLEQGYGADAIRIMELFIGPWNQSANWSVEGMGGSYRFLSRVWTLVHEHLNTKKHSQANDEINRSINLAIKRVSEDMHELGFNTAIAALMECVNDFYKLKVKTALGSSQWQEALTRLVKLMAPFTPHLAEELWQHLGQAGSVHVSSWPVHDNKYLDSGRVTIAVQVNGKVRADFSISAEASENEVIQKAKSLAKVKAHIQGQKINKTIYVKGKIVNFVV
jgi:leucyl-tRNA synthetase